MQPGRPLAFGRIGTTTFFGLPGNPVASLLAFMLFVRPALYKLAGRRRVYHSTWQARTTEKLPKKVGRREFKRGVLSYRDGARVHAGTEADPGDLAPVEAQAMVLVKAGFSPVQAMQLFIAVSRYVVGCVLEEQASPIAGSLEQTRLDEAAQAFPVLAEAMAHYRETGHAGLFERGLELMVKGAEAELSRTRPPLS